MINDTLPISRQVLAPEAETVHFWFYAGPISFVFGLMAQFIDCISIFAFILGNAVCHEFGHAIAYWLTGIPAVPCMFVTIGLSSEPSMTVALCLTVILAFAIWLAKRDGRRPLTYFLISVAICQVLLSYFLSVATQKQIILAGGQAGEVLISGLFIFLAFENLGWWWQRHRWILAILSMVSLGKATGFWLLVFFKRKELPYGAITGPEDGDLNKLINIYGWTPDGLRWLFSVLMVMGVLISLICSVMRSRIEATGSSTSNG